MPLVSIIMATYNRAHTIERAINSVLNQTMKDWELIIIDDGSTDGTKSILQKIKDPRIKIIYNDINSGAAHSRNLGFEIMKGDWFTILDSDDEILPETLEELLSVPERIDKNIDAITCNCIDSCTGGFTGHGLNKDQWVSFEALVTICKGEHWGITKTYLLDGYRFNEALKRGESILWYKISKNANRYYIHKGLRIYHTEGKDRVSNRKPNIQETVAEYIDLSKEKEYLNLLNDFRKKDFYKILTRIIISYSLINRKQEALNLIHYYRRNIILLYEIFLNILILCPTKLMKIFIQTGLKIKWKIKG